MKNLIYYYYGIKISTFKKINDYYIFENLGKTFKFIPCDIDIKKLDEIYKNLIGNRKQFYKIIINNFNSIITYYNNISYVLILVDNYIENVDITSIKKFSTPISYLNKINWKELWSTKVDYYEYQMKEIGLKYKTLVDSFDYYIGLSENAISLLIDVENIEFEQHFCHRRIKIKDAENDFYNPLNIIIDNRMRDYAEYIKVAFFDEKLNELNILDIIKQINFNQNEPTLFLSRLLYPSCYFDIYDKVIKGELAEEKINLYIKKSINYEMLLKNIYKYLSIQYNVPIIEWLES